MPYIKQYLSYTVFIRTYRAVLIAILGVCACKTCIITIHSLLSGYNPVLIVLALCKRIIHQNIHIVPPLQLDKVAKTKD